MKFLYCSATTIPRTSRHDRPGPIAGTEEGPSGAITRAQLSRSPQRLDHLAGGCVALRIGLAARSTQCSPGAARNSGDRDYAQGVLVARFGSAGRASPGFRCP